MIPYDSAYSFIVLVVSTDTNIAQMRTIMLKEAGYFAYAVKSPNEANEILQVIKFDLAILDHTLDMIDRINLVQSIRQVTSATRILVLHGSGADCGADLHLDSRDGPDLVMSGLAMLLGRAIPHED